MPGSDREYDLVRVKDASSNSKADTFFVAPKHVGRDGAGTERLVLAETDEPPTPDAGEQYLFLGTDGVLKAKFGDGTVAPIGGADSAPDSAEYVTLASDPDLTAESLHQDLTGAELHDPADHALGGAFHTADTLANLNALVSDATLDDAADARDPTLHGSTHQDGGADELDLTGLSGDLADAQDAKAHALGGPVHTADTLANLNSKVSDAVLDDTNDPRDPTSHSATHENGGTDEISVAGLSGDLADPQDPKTHGSTHSQGGTDEVTVENLGTNGAAGTVPTSDGAGGLTMSSGSGDATSDAVRVRLSSDQSISANTNTRINFDTLLYDTGGNFNTTNNTYTCPKDGVYAINLTVRFNGGGSGDRRLALIGTTNEETAVGKSSSTVLTATSTDDIFQVASLTDRPAGDDIAFWARNDGSSDVIGSGNNNFEPHAELVYLGNP